MKQLNILAVSELINGINFDFPVSSIFLLKFSQILRVGK